MVRGGSQVWSPSTSSCDGACPRQRVFFTGRGLRNVYPALSPGPYPRPSALLPPHSCNSMLTTPLLRNTQAEGLRRGAIKSNLSQWHTPQKLSPISSIWTSCSQDPKWVLVWTVCQACPYGCKWCPLDPWEAPLEEWRSAAAGGYSWHTQILMRAPESPLGLLGAHPECQQAASYLPDLLSPHMEFL